ncbi:MAG: fatty acid desaturase [Planctomycetota bacterium]|nr:fatty acid desaturase [Planctomycetota bacterium]
MDFITLIHQEERTRRMRDAKQLFQATKKYTEENVLLSWWHVASTIFILASLLTLACVGQFLPLRIIASILAGFVTTRLFVLYHDFQHHSILNGSKAAQAIFYIFGVVTMNPPSIWNRTHNHHHKNNAKTFGASIGSYPLMTIESYQRSSAKEKIQYAASRHPLTIALGYITIFFYGMCLRSLLTNPKRHLDSAFALVVHLGLIAYLALCSWEMVLLGVLVPSTIASALGAYLFYAQHNFPGVKIREREEWNYIFAALHSSSYMKMNPVMHWFSANIGYHHVHHLNARIPFYRLPEAMAGIEELQSPPTTTLNPVDIHRCLRLKLWNVEQAKLVTFREAAA